MKAIAAHRVLVAALAVFLGMQSLLCRQSLRAADGHVIYALDDTYIQMAIGKNLAAHATWGVTRYEFSGAGSSLAWPFLLAAANRAVGLDERTPFALNVAAALALLALAYAVLRRHLTSRATQAGALVLFVASVPIAVLTLVGMEHTLQAFTTLALAAAGARLCAVSAESDRQRSWMWTLIAAAAAVAVRYDSASVLVMVSVAVAVTLGWRRASAIAGAGALPAAVYAVVARSHGWPMLPSPILIKQRLSNVDPLTWRGFVDAAGGGALGILMTEPALLVLLVAALAQLARLDHSAGDERRVERRWLLLTFVGATLIHAEFGRLGWLLYRYEAYLVALGVVANAAALEELRLAPRTGRQWRLQRAAALMLALVLVFPLLQRGVHASRDVIKETRDLYRHKYQVATFLRRYPIDGVLMIGDMGMAAYYSDARIVDPGGLATRELIDMVRGPTYDDDLLLRVARDRGVRVSIRDNPAGAFQCVAEWVAPGDRDGDERPPFFAADASAAAGLERDLRAFAASADARLTTLTFARDLHRPCQARP